MRVKPNCKKIMATFLVAAFTIGFVSNVLGNNALGLGKSLKSKNNTCLGTSQIHAPVEPESDYSEWSGSYVYFGAYNGIPTIFRVLDPSSDKFGGPTMFLDCNKILKGIRFDDDSDVWADSELRTYLNTDYYNNSFSNAEKGAIASSTIESHNLQYGSSSGFVSTYAVGVYKKYVALEGDKIFLLDAEDVSNIAYGYSVGRASNNKKKDFPYWWLRSANETNNCAGNVGLEGYLGADEVTFDWIGVSPALNVDLNEVLFSTAIDGSLGQVGTTYKLTIIYDDLSVTAGSVSVSGTTFTCSATGNADQVSLLITDGEWNASGSSIIYYGAYTGSFDLSSIGLNVDDWVTKYHVYLIAEDLNYDDETDYASTPLEIAEKYTVTFSPNGGSGLMSSVTVSKNDKYVLPECAFNPPSSNMKLRAWKLRDSNDYLIGTFLPGEEVTVSKNIKAIAIWGIVYTVSYDMNGHGTAPSPQSLFNGFKADKPADPTASGYAFGGWYTDAACTQAYDFNNVVSSDITLYAKWTAVSSSGTGTGSGSGSETPSTPAPATPATAPVETPKLTSGVAHVQDTGDVTAYADSDGVLTLGTIGQGKRLEQITINFENNTPYSGTLQYRVHVQDIGWMDWTDAGQKCGTEGMSKRIEAIEIRLTGELAEYYSVEYCVHIQDYGDMQGWVHDGALAGTTGESKRIEQLKINIVPKGIDETTAVMYRVHVQDYGWEKTYACNGAMSGTSGESKRLEGIELFLSGVQYSGGIKYKTHVQDYGWQDWCYDGEMSGTQGESKRLEGICIELYGEIADKYDIYYRVHAQDIGWMGWAKNGECAGTAGRSARLEGIQIVLVPKGSPAPDTYYEGISSVTEKAFVEGF